MARSEALKHRGDDEDYKIGGSLGPDLLGHAPALSDEEWLAQNYTRPPVS